MFFELHPRDTEDVARTRGCPREEGSKERWNLGGSREDFLCCGDVNPKVLAPPFLFLQALEDLLGRCEGAENDSCWHLLQLGKCSIDYVIMSMERAKRHIAARKGQDSILKSKCYAFRFGFFVELMPCQV